VFPQREAKASEVKITTVSDVSAQARVQQITACKPLADLA
jgi:hypothetical protein